MRKYQRKKGAIRRRKYRGRYRKRVSKSVKTYVKSAIHRNIENKIKVGYAANNSIPTALAGATSPYQYNLLPVLNEGAEDGERIASKVKPMKNTFRAYVNLLPHNALTNPDFPIMVRCWIVKYKLQNRNAATMNLADFDAFFDTGTTAVGFQGNMLDMLLPVNKSQWIVYEERKFKLGVGQNAGGYSGGNNALDNSSFNRQIVFYCSKHWKTSLDYTDNTVDRPTNTSLFFVCQAVAANGTAVIGPTCEIHYTHRFEYEDA